MSRQNVPDTCDRVGPILFDFDGPITGLFHNGRNGTIANRMRAILNTHSINLPEDIAHTYDPLMVLRWTHAHTSKIIYKSVEEACILGETQAAAVSAPTPGAHDLISACHKHGHIVGILSNNCAEAIVTYLRHRRIDEVARIFARPRGRPNLMKPSPHLADSAIRELGVASRTVLFIGDSLTDLQTARNAGMPFVGYGKTPKRAEELRKHGAELVVEHMADIRNLLTRNSDLSANP